MSQNSEKSSRQASLPVVGMDLYSLGVAAVGAVVFLYHALFRRRRFLNMD